MSTGEIFSIIEGTGVWPPSEPVLARSEMPDGTKIAIRLTTRSYFEIAIQDASGAVGRLTTQRISPRGAGVLVLNVRWDGLAISFAVGGVELKSIADANGAVAAVHTGEFTGDMMNSFDDPGAAAACAGRMLWRKTKLLPFLSGIAPRRAETPKNLSQRLGDIQRTSALLRQFARECISGDSSLAGTAATWLRSLVHHGNLKSKNYNPVLLRVAAELDLPLPIYVFPPPDPAIQALLDESVVMVRNSAPTTTRRFSLLQVCDLQDWLESKLQIRRDPTGTVTTSNLVGEVISEVANTMGAAHLGDGVPHDLDALRKQSFGSADALVVVVLNATNVACTLIDYLLRMAPVQPT